MEFLKLRPWVKKYLNLFSLVGLCCATLFFAFSLAPSLLPRVYVVQGVLSGFALAIGYGFGIFIVCIWRYLELPEFSGRSRIRLLGLLATISVIIASIYLYRASIWQNSIRTLMEMPPVDSVYPGRVAAISIILAVLLLGISRQIRNLYEWTSTQANKVVPRRVSHVLSALVVGWILLSVVTGVFGRNLLSAADTAFLNLDAIIDEGISKPVDKDASGSAASLIDWETIGRWGKHFIVEGPDQAEISSFLNRPASKPLRVYAGLGSGETVEDRAELALEELKRVNAFDRPILIVATPTGTGWLDPGAVDTIEYLHAGNIATVSMQYSYLPSWLTILVDPDRARVSARALFDEVYGYWTTLPKDSRPKLYLHGLSLGAYGSEASADLLSLMEDPIQGALWSGPPFPSHIWSRVTKNRNPGSFAWMPKFRDGSVIRFTGRQNYLNQPTAHWGSIRVVYIQHASDPMGFFSPDILTRRPDWLVGQRGPDVSHYLSWLPIITFLQIGFDLPMATTVPFGYGHNFAPFIL